MTAPLENKIDYDIRFNASKVKRVRAMLLNQKGRRQKGKLCQTDFWRKYGVTQSGGSRHEMGRTLPTPVQILMVLEDAGIVSERNLVEAAALVEQCGLPRLRGGSRVDE